MNEPLRIGLIGAGLVTTKDGTPFETAPEDDLGTLQLVEDRGWEASR